MCVVNSNKRQKRAKKYRGRDRESTASAWVMLCEQPVCVCVCVCLCERGQWPQPHIHTPHIHATQQTQKHKNTMYLTAFRKDAKKWPHVYVCAEATRMHLRVCSHGAGQDFGFAFDTDIQHTLGHTRPITLPT